MSQHQATFTWGAGPDSVHVAGGWNGWSDSASPLHKQADGTFSAEIPLPWGEKQAFKYIVDGEWKVREDEAKEWDAAGNMNNVYTAPAAPLTPSSPVKKAEPTPAPAPAAAAAVPPTPAPIPVPAPVDTVEPTVKSTDAPAPADKAAPVAEPAPVAAAASSLPVLGAPALGAPVTNTSADKSSLVAKVETAPVVVPLPTNPPAGASTKAEEIEKTAASAPIGESATQEHEEGFLEKAAAFGAVAVAGLGTAAGQAAVAVERVTGLDLAHGNPLSVEEARARGINVDSIPQIDAPTDTTSPAGIPPSKTAIADLENKVNDLKVDDAGAPKQTGVAAVPLPNGSAPKRTEAPVEPHKIHAEEAGKNDIPSQAESAATHKTVPAPVITDVTQKDPKKDRTMFGTSEIDTAATKPISTDPSVSARDAKHEAEKNPGLNGSTGETARAGPGAGAGGEHAFSSSGTASTPVGGPAASGPLPAGETSAAPDRKSNNLDAPTPVKKDEPKETSTPTALTAPATPAKNKATNGEAKAETPGSINSTPQSTPAKSTHGREATGGSDIRKRKSSFFHKIKSAFSPKDKEKK